MVRSAMEEPIMHRRAVTVHSFKSDAIREKLDREEKDRLVVIEGRADQRRVVLEVERLYAPLGVEYSNNILC